MGYSLKQRLPQLIIIAALTFILLSTGFVGAKAFAATTNGIATVYQCGTGGEAVYTSINIGCKGNNCAPGAPNMPPYCNDNNPINPIIDMLFAVIRLLSDGVGILVIGSIVVGGIQFSTSRSDPQAAAAAINRVRTSLIALLIYIFAYSILYFVIPNGFFQS